MGWRKLISREVSSSLPRLRLGDRNANSASKLKLNQITPLQNRKIIDPAPLTPIGQTIRATGDVAAKVTSVPRVMAHAAVIALVGAVVIGGSTGHSARLSPLAAAPSSSGSVLEKAAAVEVASKVAEQTDLLVTSDISSTAKTLNASVTMPTADDGTLASRQVVDTAGNATRGIISYKVVAGDTLTSVAAQFNITTDTLRWANSLKADASLTPGQALSVLPISGVQHTVVAGETAETLAAKYQANADQIIAFNNAEVSGLVAGSTIVVPDGVIVEAAPAKAVAAPAAKVNSTPVRFVGGGPNSYAYGYCTYYVASRRSVPSYWGNASSWYYNAQSDGYGVGSVPRPGAIAWTGAGYYGHVAYVESVSGGMVTVSEMNYNGNWNRVTYRTVSASSFRYIY